MAHYWVTWTVEVSDAPTPRDAAKVARDVFVKDPNACPMFDVTDQITQQDFRIDLSEPMARGEHANAR